MLIYKATNKINGKSYIGQTVKSLKQRKQKHISDAMKQRDDFHFHRALKKYNIKNFDWEILIEGTCSSETLNRLEIHFIQLYNTFEKGYNLNIGGKSNVGFKHSEETKKRMSITRKGKLAGKNNPFYGKKLSEDHKRKISKAHMGRFVGKNSPMFGKQVSDETIEKLSKAHMGKNNSQAKAVIINNKYFYTIIEAARVMNVTRATIRHRIKKGIDGYRHVCEGEN